MRADIRAMLERQAAWQRSRVARSWSEKLRASVCMRRALTQLKKRSSAVTLEDSGWLGSQVHDPDFQSEDGRIRSCPRETQAGESGFRIPVATARSTACRRPLTSSFW